jgi:hypothetical protein
VFWFLQFLVFVTIVFKLVEYCRVTVFELSCFLIRLCSLGAADDKLFPSFYLLLWYSFLLGAESSSEP